MIKSLRLPGAVDEYKQQIDNPNIELKSFDERLYEILNNELRLRKSKKV